MRQVVAVGVAGTLGIAVVLSPGLGASAAPAPRELVAAPAVISADQFLTRSPVRRELAGRGKWVRNLGEPDFLPLGANPAQCRSDLPFAGAVASQGAFYFGPLRSTKRFYGEAQVTVREYPDAAAAQAAVTAAAAFAIACPQSTEWVCEQCDGVWDYQRTPARGRKVGEQSTAWSQDSQGLARARGRVIVARSGVTVVEVYAGRTNDPTDTKVPKPPTWKRTVALAKRALRKATSQ